MAHGLEALQGGSAGPPTPGFVVAYVASGGAEARRPLADVWAVRREGGVPVRAFASESVMRRAF
ncbi:hypothetical protein [Streptomyces chrestomyceticus]|uniref:hypothetical protein n=1 Tax=Streptomyces chrestomyceticus TaxID=68185 RepID=UPI0037A66234